MNIFKDLKQLNNLKYHAINYYFFIATAGLDDTVTLLSANELECTYFCIIRTIHHAMGAINALKDNINLTVNGYRSYS